jgi:hypothetical protein
MLAKKTFFGKNGFCIEKKCNFAHLGKLQLILSDREGEIFI